MAWIPWLRSDRLPPAERARLVEMRRQMVDELRHDLTSSHREFIRAQIREVDQQLKR